MPASGNDSDSGPTSFPFPAEAVRRMRAQVQASPRGASRNGPAPLDGGSCAAAKRVEEALARVERGFHRLRLLIDHDDDRPRAA